MHSLRKESKPFLGRKSAWRRRRPPGQQAVGQRTSSTRKRVTPRQAVATGACGALLLPWQALSAPRWLWALALVAASAACAVGQETATATAVDSTAATSPIAIGPYVQYLTTETARICWATVSAEVTIADGQSKTEVRRAYDHHEIVLGNLRPNTTYTYDVLGSANPAGTGKFTTVPEDSQPYTFVAYGDTRSQHEVHQRLVNRVIAEAPRFVLLSGDLVSDGMQIGEWEKFFAVEKELLRNVCLWPVLGNHENDSPYYFDFFSLPGNERYYMFAAGDVLFVMLDDQGPDYPVPGYMTDADRDLWWSTEGPNQAYMETQKAWFEHMLSLNERAGYIIVVFHEPLISVKRSRVKDARRRREYWGDIWQRYRVSMILCGHDHHYHRAVVAGVQYVTSAGGGAGLYDADTPAPETVKLAKVHHYLRFEVDADSTTVTAVDLDGNQIDQFQLRNRRLSR